MQLYSYIPTQFTNRSKYHIQRPTLSQHLVPRDSESPAVPPIVKFGGRQKKFFGANAMTQWRQCSPDRRYWSLQQWRRSWGSIAPPPNKNTGREYLFIWIRESIRQKSPPPSQKNKFGLRPLAYNTTPNLARLRRETRTGERREGERDGSKWEGRWTFCDNLDLLHWK